MYIEVDFSPELRFRKLGIKYDYTFFLVHDLFLLKNQLPFRLLRLIIGHASEEDKLLNSIYNFIFSLFRQTENWYKNKNEVASQSHVASIGKLREAGINLKSSKTSCVGDISFSGGTLKLPPIYFAEPTAASFLNMLGYEMCFLNKSEVTTYMYILSKLIDQTQDVVELREKNILRNQPGSDEEVVKLFNEISTHLIPDFQRYFELESNIDNFFDNKGLMWLRKVSHDIHQYFKGRWSLLAFIGALLAVASSVIQTVITVLAYQADSKRGN
ncbi:hypothetical protein Dsin_011947 [Dipteronia sinensis]|uniref:Uncharacterized protein n=1 Tax=Dipteronia sinensis TaxID=43782 RepID=A0AAE0AIF7_9ROSI|nr:hypothetical protein Dsin_011947 [Dipteronia sinensis]